MTGTIGTLDRYVLRRMASIYGLCLATFVLLFLVVDGFSRLDEFLGSAQELQAQGQSVWKVAAAFYWTKIPRIVSAVGPYMTLFAGIATLLSLARTNEVVPMLTAGRSIHRVLLPVYAFALLAAAGLGLLEDRVVPRAIRENETLSRHVKDMGRVEHTRIEHLTDGPNRFSVGRWLPSPGDRKLTGVLCQRYTDPTGRLPVGALEVKELLYREHQGKVGWFPVGGTLSPSAPGPEGRIAEPIRLPTDVPLAFSFTPEDIDIAASSSRQDGLEREELLALRARHPMQHKWAVDLHTRVTRPVASFVLFLLGIPFVASPEKRGIAWGLGLALCVCVTYFAVDFGCREFGAWGAINPVVAVWTPPILFTAVALALMDRVVT